MDGTREKVIKEIMDWVDVAKGPNILWLRSMPGAGKSAIAQTLVQLLIKKRRSGGNFFFSRDDTERRTPFALWCHILYSLSCQFPGFKRKAAEHIRVNLVEVQSSQASDILKIVFETLASLEEGDIPLDEMPVIVVDALDECPMRSLRPSRRRQSVLDGLHRFSQLSSRIKFIVTSREDSDIRNVLENGISHSVHLHTGEQADEYISQDIRHYLKQELVAHIDGSYLTHERLEKLSQRAAGLFVWASIAIRFVVHPSGTPVDRFERLLEDGELGKHDDELSKLYHILLTEEFGVNPDGSVALAFQRVVGTLVVAATPLTLDELVNLLADSQDPTPLGKSSVKRMLERIGMVTSKPTTASHIRFSHRSFPEFLLRPHSQNQFYEIDRYRSESYLTFRCLYVMNTNLRFIIGRFPSYHTNDKYATLGLVKERISPALRYAVQYFASHLVKHPPSSDLLAILQTFFDEHLLHWLELMSLLALIPTTTVALHAILDWISKV